VRQFLEHATGLSIYPLISFVFFSVIFIGVLVYTFTADQKQIESLGRQPLDEDFPA